MIQNIIKINNIIPLVELKDEPKKYQCKFDRNLLPGDCLRILERCPPIFKLIYLDPPFNSRLFYFTGMEQTEGFLQLSNEEKENNKAQSVVFNDTWKWDTSAQEMFLTLTEKTQRFGARNKDLIDAIYKLFPTPIDGEYTPLAYFVYMIPRLYCMRKALVSTGSIYLHCDPHASHYLKIIMDSIFGHNNFRNEIIWHYTGGLNAKKNYPCKHDVILFYSKSSEFGFNIQREPYSETSGYAKSGIVSASGKKYMPNVDGKPFDDVWNIPIINPMAKERLGYPTQKPEPLLERIILASTNKGDHVLDPFCGGGTTLDMAEKHDRKYTGIDISKVARDLTFKRLSKYDWKWKYYNVSINTSVQTLDEKSVCLPKEMADFDKIITPDEAEYIVGDMLGAEIPPWKIGVKEHGIDRLITTTYKEEEIKTGLGITTMNMANGGLQKFKDLPTSIDNTGCRFGVFVSKLTQEELTPDMKLTIQKRGVFKDTDYNIIQAISFKQLMNGERPRIPGKQWEPIFKEIKKLMFVINPPKMEQLLIPKKINQNTTYEI